MVLLHRTTEVWFNSMLLHFSTFRRNRWKGTVSLVRVYILFGNNKTFSAISAISASASSSTTSSSTSSIVSPSAAEATGFAGWVAAESPTTTWKDLARETLTLRQPFFETKPYLSALWRRCTLEEVFLIVIRARNPTFQLGVASTRLFARAISRTTIAGCLIFLH